MFRQQNIAAVLLPLTLTVATLQPTAADEPLHQVVEPSTFWANGSTIRVQFLNGEIALQNKVMRYARHWSKFANITFVESRKANSQIRVQFDNRFGHNSLLGTRALNVHPPKHTMNLGVTMSTPDREFGRVVYHEFGHVLGLQHEQFYDGAKIPWDVNAVYLHFAKPPNNWNKAKVDHNILMPKGTKFGIYDKFSIMHYPIPNSLTRGDFEVPTNFKLSENDKINIALIYPRFNSTTAVTSHMVNRSFDGRAFGPFKITKFGTNDSVRGWSWSKNLLSYLSYQDSKTKLFIREHNETGLLPTYRELKFNEADTLRGWDWDPERQIASYIAFVPQLNNKSILYIRKFDGEIFGPERQISFSTGDNIRGWSWDGQTASYVAIDPKSNQTTLFVRPFNGEKFTSEYETMPFGTADTVRGWSFDKEEASYFIIKHGS